ncbi:hypothetical protein PIB30_083489 [Stylosanthes scabra]|uniref:Uncharacterized protein n=1 Tax=Stylosanthes scabra TaxID=79078 RepID=A0ABU6WS40_9FABA|nr:hypothetical protein [Stylosanthes scabra]
MCSQWLLSRLLLLTFERVLAQKSTAKDAIVDGNEAPGITSTPMDVSDQGEGVSSKSLSSSVGSIRRHGVPSMPPSLTASDVNVNGVPNNGLEQSKA